VRGRTWQAEGLCPKSLTVTTHRTYKIGDYDRCLVHPAWCSEYSGRAKTCTLLVCPAHFIHTALKYHSNTAGGVIATYNEILEQLSHSRAKREKNT